MMNNKLVLKIILALVSTLLFSTNAKAFWGATYNKAATVTAHVEPSGSGKVYVAGEASSFSNPRTRDWKTPTSEGGNSSTTSGASLPVFIYAQANTGYNFLGWSATSDGTLFGSSDYVDTYTSGNIHGVKKNYTAYSGSGSDEERYDIYARFELITYDIEYAPGLKGSGSMGVTPYTIKSTGAVPSASFTAANGYEFDKWRVDACDSNGYWPAVGSTVNSGTSLTGKIGNLSLTALWKLVDYTISFSANGGTGTNPADIHYNVESSSFSLPACPYTKSGYVFAGWKPSANSGSWNTSQLFAGGASIPTGQYGNVTLVAQWESLASITISVTGLKTGESAMFNLRKNDAYGDILYTVVLTSDNSSVTIKNLETGVQYYAQPVSAWNWYTMSPTSSSHTLDSDGYTFSFTATAKDKKHDETYNANWKQ